MVEVEKVVLVGGIIPFDVSELVVVAHIVVSEAAVEQDASDVSVVRFVGCIELVSMVVHPNLELLLWSFVMKMWWSLPSVGDCVDCDGWR